MGVNLISIDDFIPEFQSLRRFLDGSNYDGVVNPVDKVFYPGISADIPPYVAKCAKIAITNAVGFDIDIDYQFLRLSVDGVKAPHQAHSDMTMAKYLCVHYLNRQEDCQGGTSMVRHIETGMYSHPENEEELQAWKRDHSTPDAWEILAMCKMKENRAFICDSQQMHRAEPVSGFGKGAADGRMVMITFFNRSE